MNVNRVATAFALYAGIACAAAPAQELFALTTSAEQAAALPAAESAGFDWNGFYAGIFTGLRADASASATVGVNVGVNTQFEFVLVGAEVAVQGLAETDAIEPYGQILGRAGLVVADDMAVYAAGGYGIELGQAGGGDFLLGAGVELGLTEDVSLRAQYLRGFPEQAGGDFQQVTLGAQFQF